MLLLKPDLLLIAARTNKVPLMLLHQRSLNHGEKVVKRIKILYTWAHNVKYVIRSDKYGNTYISLHNTEFIFHLLQSMETF